MNSASLLELLNGVKKSYYVLDVLQEAKFAVTDITDESDSVLHLLAKSRHAQTRDFFDYLQELVNAGADVNIADRQGSSFLSYYLENNLRHKENDTFQLLLKNENFDINQMLISGQTFFEFIYHSDVYGCRDSMEMFIRHKKFNPNHKTSKYNSILLHMVAEDVFTHREHMIDVARNPLTNPNTQNDNGQTALGLILSDTDYKSADHMLLITALIKHEQCDIDVLDNDGNNYLQLTVMSCKFQAKEIAQLLINRGIDVTHKNSQGQSLFDLIRENRAGRSDYANKKLLLDILALHPASLLERYADGDSILSEIFKSNDYTFKSEFTTLIKLCNSQDNDEGLLENVVAECFTGFHQGLVSAHTISALTKALIGANININIEYFLALTAICNPAAEKWEINSNFKTLKPNLDLKVVINHIKNLTQDNSNERQQALAYLGEFGFSLDNFDDEVLVLEDEYLHAKIRQDIQKATKMFGHLFSLSGSIPVNNGLIKLTGSSPLDTAPFMVHLMNAYVSHCETNDKYTEHLDAVRQVRNMTVKSMRFYLMSKLWISSYQSTSTSKENMLLSMVEDSKNSGVEIITGWPGHTMNLVIKQDDLYRNNGGGCSIDVTTEHYKISKPENITKDLFATLDDDGNESNKTYIQRDMHSRLGLVFVGSIPGDFQTVGNCSLYSLLIALKSKYRLFLPETIADQLFADTIEFFEQFYLKEYLSLYANNPTLPHLLIRLIIQELMPTDQLELTKRLLAEHFNSEINQEILNTGLMLERWELVVQSRTTERFDKRLEKLGIVLDPTSMSARLQMLHRFLSDQVTAEDLDELKSWPLHEQTFQGYHLLHFAVMNNNIVLVSSLIQMFPHAVNQTTWYDQEPLCLVKSVEMIDTLINAGASVTRTEEGNALDCAIKADRDDLVNALLICGAKPSEYSAYYAASRDSKILKSLIEHYPETVTKPTHNYSTSIHAAARAGRSENIHSLIYYGGANPDSSDVNGVTPLQLALRNGQNDAARLLIQYPGTLFKAPHRGDRVVTMTQDGDIQMMIETLEQKKQAALEHFELFKNSKSGIIEEDIDYLIVAIRKNNLLAIRGYILTYPNIKVVSTSKLYCTSPLEEAIRRLAGRKGEEYDQAFEIVKMLFKTPAIDINATQASSEPLLFWATSIGDVNVLELFLADPKLKPNEQDNIGYTALHDAVERGHLNCVKRLLQDPRVDSTISNRRGQTAADVESFRYRSRECAEAVLEHQGNLRNIMMIA